MLLTFDIEDYYKNFCKYQLQENVEFNKNFLYQTKEISKYLKQLNIVAIFYILGEVAEFFPDLIRSIKNDNHLIGIHGYNHENISKFSKTQFENDIKKCLKILKTIDRKIEINHYRSPSFSMLQNIDDYYDVLNKYKINFSSSLSYAKYKKLKDITNFHDVKELPIPSFNFIFIDYKFTGGSYFRLTPMFLIILFSKFFKNKNLIYYFHPYDFYYKDKLNPFKHSNKIKKINNLRTTIKNIFYNLNTRNNMKKFIKIAK